MRRWFFKVEYDPERFPAVIMRVWEVDPKKVLEKVRKARRVKVTRFPRYVLCDNCGKECMPDHYFMFRGRKMRVIWFCEECEKLIFSDKDETGN